jgi:dynein heavy chain
MLPGDILLVTAFISYVGCFTKYFRLDLLNKLWLPNLRNLEVKKYELRILLTVY